MGGARGAGLTPHRHLMDAGAYAFIFDAEHRHWWFRARRELLADVVTRFVPAGAPFLDVGCGTGALLARLGDAVEPWGIEMAPDAAARARARGGLRVHEGGYDALATLPRAHFAGVGFFDVLEHLDDDAHALALARDALRPGGVVVATVPAYRWLWTAHDDQHGHRRRYTRVELGARLRAAGLEPELLTYFNARLFPVAVAARLAGRLAAAVTGAPAEAETRVPPAPLNALLERVFLSERAVLARAGRAGGFRAGLSVLAVGRRA